MIRYKTIENYSWEDDGELVKIYLNKNDLNKNVSKESCKVELLDKDQTAVIIVDNAKLVIKNLAHPVKTIEDLVKFTKSFVIVRLKKVDNKKWTTLQKTTSAVGKGLDDFKPEGTEDPSQSMMNLMKK